MKIGDIKNIKAAKKYATALFKSSLEEQNEDKIYNDLLFICETIDSNIELKKVLSSPAIEIENKKAVIEKIFSIHINKITLDFMFLLTENNRLDAFAEIINQYSDLLNEHFHIVKPLITSAVELTYEQKEQINQKLEYKLEKKVLPEYRINPEIIGGFIIEIEDKTIDCSLKAKFENMRKQLTKGSRYGNN